MWGDAEIAVEGRVKRDAVPDKFVPVLGGNGIITAPTGDIFDQLPGQMR